MRFSSFISSALRTSALAVVLSSVLWLTSCDDDPEPDKVLPELTVTSLADNATVWDVVSITLDVKDDRGVDKVELFVDGSLVTTLMAAPYSTDWDTNSLTDGAHVVKVVATDKSGNAVEKEIPVTVKNVLVSFTVPQNHLWSNSEGSIRGFLFLSDADGKVIKSVEYQNGQSVEIKSPGYKAETFNLTQAIVAVDADGNSPSLFTFFQVERGKWSLLGDFSEDESETVAGQATLNFSNGMLGQPYELTGPGYDHGNFYASFEGGTASAVIDLKKSPVSLYAVRSVFDNEGMARQAFYRMYNNVAVGANAINLGAVTLPLTKLTPSVPTSLEGASIRVWGSLVANNFTDYYRLGNFYRYTSTDASIEVYIPGTTFPSYYAEVSSWEEDVYEYLRGTGNMNQLNVSAPQYQGSVTYSNKKINSSVTGSFDFLTTSFEFNEDLDADWAFVLPVGANVSVTVPEVPDNLKNFNIPVVNASPDAFELYDYENISDYATLKSYMRTATDGLDGMEDVGKEYTWIVSYQDTPVGRVKKGQTKKHDLPVSKN